MLLKTLPHMQPCGKSNKPNRVPHELSNLQIGNKLERGSSNPKPPVKPCSNNMLKLKLVTLLKAQAYKILV